MKDNVIHLSEIKFFPSKGDLKDLSTIVITTMITFINIYEKHKTGEILFHGGAININNLLFKT